MTHQEAMHPDKIEALETSRETVVQTDPVLPVEDRAVLAMTAVRKRVLDLVAEGCLMPFTEHDLVRIVQGWSVGPIEGSDYKALMHEVVQRYMSEYA